VVAVALHQKVEILGDLAPNALVLLDRELQKNVATGDLLLLEMDLESSLFLFGQ